MITLALDTASSNCAVALIDDGRVLARVSETIGKGHAEKLIDQIIAVKNTSGQIGRASWRDRGGIWAAAGQG